MLYLTENSAVGQAQLHLLKAHEALTEFIYIVKS